MESSVSLCELLAQNHCLMFIIRTTKFAIRMITFFISSNGLGNGCSQFAIFSLNTVTIVTSMAFDI